MAARAVTENGHKDRNQRPSRGGRALKWWTAMATTQVMELPPIIIQVTRPFMTILVLKATVQKSPILRNHHKSEEWEQNRRFTTQPRCFILTSKFFKPQSSEFWKSFVPIGVFEVFPDLRWEPSSAPQQSTGLSWVARLLGETQASSCRNLEFLRDTWKKIQT